MAAFGHRLPADAHLQRTGAVYRLGLPGHQKPLPHAAGRRHVCVLAQADRSSSWYEHSNRNSAPSQPKSSSSPGSATKQRSKHYYESTPKRRKNTPYQQDSNQWQRQQQQPRQQQQVDDYDDDLEYDGPGWWEGQRGVRQEGQDNAGLNLLPWQEERLLIAAAGSKKKMQVKDLALDLGVDRSEVLSWVATFRAKPKHEQDKLLAPLQGRIQQQQQQQAAVKQQQQQQQRQQQLIDSSWGDVSQPSSSSRGSSSSGQLPFSAPNPNTGFVPFAERRGTGQTKGKRLPGEVLRTLEHLYDRGPWPNKDTVAGVWELHKVPKDVVLDWFAARREMAGLPDNPRLAKKAGMNLAAAEAVAAAAAQQTTLQPQQQQQQGSQKAGTAAAAPAVSLLTAKELAALRSSLPSPNKFKGAKLSQELGIKAVEGPGATPKQVEISGVVFLARDGKSAWRKVWRRRRVVNGFPLQRLDFSVWCRRRGISDLLLVSAE